MSRSGDFNPSRSRRTSRSVRSNVVGTHVGIGNIGGRPTNASAVGFSNPRKQRRATRGYVSSVLDLDAPAPSGKSGRISPRRFDREVHRKRRLSTAVAAVVVLAVALVVAAGVGVAVFLGSLDSRLALGDSNAASALRTPSREGSFYSLVLADFSLESDSKPERVRSSSPDDPLSLDVSDNAADGLASSGQSASAPVTVGSAEQASSNDAFALVRVDTANRTAQVIAIPSNVTATLDDGLLHTLSDIWDQAGDAGVVDAVSALAGVPVSHVLKTDAEGLRSLVDAVGGLSVSVGEEVDDPRAGSVYLAAGMQEVDGDGALTLVRATNLSGGSAQVAENRIEVLRALSVKLLSLDAVGFFSLVDGLPEGSLRTDESTGGVNRLLSTMGGVDAQSVSGIMLPGDDITRDGIVIYRVSEDALAQDLRDMEQGQPLAAPEPPAQADPSSFTVFVKNGSGITGAAASISDSLKERGYNVEGVGNTDVEAYDETLVVYAQDEYEEAARSIVEELGVGRPVSDYAGFYQLETDVLIIVGRDWKPSE